jgi:serine/threonine-protein kinase
MDLLDGEPLRKRLKRGAMPIAEAVQLIDEIASALISAHGKGFAHRDLKPDNVFLVENPVRLDVKLLDFGLAKLLPGAGQRAYRTATGAQLGTPDYMSPEQLRASGKLDERTDIFSLGVMALETITGIRPRRLGDGKYDLDDTPASLIAAVAGAPRELAQLIERMMATSPADRPSLANIRQTLKRLRPSLPQISAVDAPDEPSIEDELTASKVGAKPVLPTPQAGIQQLPPAEPPDEPMRQTRRSHPPPMAGLRGASPHPSTTLGVPPPPARPRPATAPPRTPTAGLFAESKIWLVIGALLVVGAAVALLLVLAT